MSKGLLRSSRALALGFALCLALALGIPLCVEAAITPPAQPSTGPGGSSYPYAGSVQSGPYYSSGSAAAQSYYIYQPSGNPAPASLPVVLFLHGYLLDQEPKGGDSPQNYMGWITHIVRKGYTVVFPIYDTGATPAQFAGNITASWGAALKKLASGGFIPARSDGLGIQAAFVGHSLGAVEALTVAQTLDEEASSGRPRALGIFTPGLGKTTLSLNFNAISASTSVVLVDGDEDTSNDIATAQTIWSSLGIALADSQRDFLEVISDSHGSPAQLGNHWFPLTNGLNDTASIDNRDYNVTWKLSVGLLDCVFSATDCSYVLTHGGSDEVGMGLWSDEQAVHPLVDIP